MLADSVCMVHAVHTEAAYGLVYAVGGGAVVVGFVAWAWRSSAPEGGRTRRRNGKLPNVTLHGQGRPNSRCCG